MNMNSARIQEEVVPLAESVIEKSFGDGFFAPKQLEISTVSTIASYVNSLLHSIDPQNAKRTAFKVGGDIPYIILHIQSNSRKNNEHTLDKAIDNIKQSVIHNLPGVRKNTATQIADGVGKTVKLFSEIRKKAETENSRSGVTGSGVIRGSGYSWLSENPRDGSSAIAGGNWFTDFFSSKFWGKQISDEEAEQRQKEIDEREAAEAALKANADLGDLGDDDEYEGVPWQNQKLKTFGKAMLHLIPAAAATTAYFTLGPAAALSSVAMAYPLIKEWHKSVHQSMKPNMSNAWRRKWDKVENFFSGPVGYHLDNFVQGALNAAPIAYQEYQANKAQQEEYDRKLKIAQEKLDKKNAEARKKVLIENSDLMAKHAEEVEALDRDNALKLKKHLEEEHQLDTDLQKNAKKLQEEFDDLKVQIYVTYKDGLPLVDDEGNKIARQQLMQAVGVGVDSIPGKDMTGQQKSLVKKILDFIIPSKDYKKLKAERKNDFQYNPRMRKEIEAAAASWGDTGYSYTRSSLEDLQKIGRDLDKKYKAFKSAWEKDDKKAIDKATKELMEARTKARDRYTEAKANLESVMNQGLPQDTMELLREGKDNGDPFLVFDHKVDLPDLKEEKSLPMFGKPKLPPILKEFPEGEELPPDYPDRPKSSYEKTQKAVEAIIKGYKPYEPPAKAAKEKEYSSPSEAKDTYDKMKLKKYADRQAELARSMSMPHGRASTLNTVIVPAKKENKLFTVTPLQGVTSLGRKTPHPKLVVQPLKRQRRF